MFNLQGSEIIFILLLALVVLGPEKLPSAIRKFTQTYAEIRKMGMGFQTELKSALDEPMREMKETADLLRDAADPMKVVADAEAGSAADAATEREAERQLRAREIHDQRSARAADDAPDDNTESSTESMSDAVVSEAESEEIDEWADPIEAGEAEASTAEPDVDPIDSDPEAGSDPEAASDPEPEAVSEPEPGAEAAADAEPAAEADAKTTPVAGVREVTELVDRLDSASVESHREDRPETVDAVEEPAADAPESLSGAVSDREAST